MTDDFMDALREVAAKSASLPPPPKVMIARADVPAGRVFRYYNTEGDMIVYISLTDFGALPRDSGPQPLFGAAKLGRTLGSIPVVVE